MAQRIRDWASVDFHPLVGPGANIVLARVTAEVYSHAILGRDDEAVTKWQEFQRKRHEAVGDGRGAGAMTCAIR